MSDLRVTTKRRQHDRRVATGVVALAIVFFVLPSFVSTYNLYQYELVLLYIAAAIGLNVAIGYSGEILMAQATVMGVAAYVAGLLAVDHGWSAAETFPVAIVCAVVWQLIVCIPGLRIREIYLGIVSFLAVLAFSDISVIFQRWTGGTLGLLGIPVMISGSDGTANAGRVFDVIALIALLSFVLVYNVVSSSWGARFRALRDARLALPTVGIGVASTKLVAYVFAALPAAAAGWALAYVNQDVTPSVFGVSLALILFAGVQLIKPGSLLGPVVGTALLEGYSQLVGPFSQYNVFGLGLFLAVVVILFPGGVGGRSAAVAKIVQLGSRLAPRVDRWTARIPRVGHPLRHIPAVDSDAPRSGEPASTWERIEGDTAVSLEVTDLTRSFGGNLAVDSVCFEATGGRVLALVGANGSGKTTTLNMMSGLLVPTRGTVTVNGWVTSGRRTHEIARRGYSRTFQVPQVVGEASVRENVEIGLLREYGSSVVAATFLPWRARRMNRRRAERAVSVCAQLGLDESLWEKRVDEIPLGLRRLVEVGRVLATGASVICLDEPTAGLNDEEVAHLSRVLRMASASGRAIIVVEHNVNFVLRTCDDVVLLDRGQVIGAFRDVDVDNLPVKLMEHFGSFSRQEVPS